jgi:dienelactone hydrolase
LFIGGKVAGVALAAVAFVVVQCHASRAQEEPEAIAKLSEPGRKGYRAYLDAGFNKVFVLSPSGNWQYNSRQPNLEETAKQALAKCQERSSTPCRVFSLNNTEIAGDYQAFLQQPQGSAEYGVLRQQPFVTVRGPAEARGLIVWSHGYLHGADATESLPQPYVSRFHLAGYDVYRFDRRWTTRETYSGQIQDLIDATEQARRAGYKRIVLAGQSHGGWTSLDAAARGARVDAVIAVAPARHGRTRQMTRGDEAFSDFADLAKRVARSNAVVAMAFFANDDYDVGGRGAEAKAQFTGREAPSLVIDTPTGFSGHGAGNLAPFTDRFGGCLFDLADAAKKSAPCF